MTAMMKAPQRPVSALYYGQGYYYSVGYLAWEKTHRGTSPVRARP